jgi:hypothetical protein
MMKIRSRLWILWGQVAVDLMVHGSEFREFWKGSKENRSGPSTPEGNVASAKRNHDFVS